MIFRQCFHDCQLIRMSMNLNFVSRLISELHVFDMVAYLWATLYYNVNTLTQYPIILDHQLSKSHVYFGSSTSLRS